MRKKNYFRIKFSQKEKFAIHSALLVRQSHEKQKFSQTLLPESSAQYNEKYLIIFNATSEDENASDPRDPLPQ